MGCRAPRLPAGREPAKPDAWLLISPSLYIFRKCQSLRHFEKRGIPAQTDTNRVKGGRNLASPKFGSKRRCRKGMTLAFCTHSFQVPLLLGTVPCGKHTLPGTAPPSQGLVSEDWDGIQTKVGFQLAGKPAPNLSLLLSSWHSLQTTR